MEAAGAKKSLDTPPTYQMQQRPITGTTRLLKIRYQECFDHRDQDDQRHGYDCVNLPGLPIATRDLPGHSQFLSEATATYLTTLLDSERFEGWAFYSWGNREKRGQAQDCQDDCELFGIEIVIVKLA